MKRRPLHNPPPAGADEARGFRYGPHLGDKRSIPLELLILLNKELPAKEARDKLRVQHPVLIGLDLLEGELAGEEAAELAVQYLRESEARLRELIEKVVQSPVLGQEPIGAQPPGREGLICLNLAKHLATHPAALVLAALVLYAGIELGRLEEAEVQAREILAGYRVRRGSAKGARVRAKECGTPPTAQRLDAWKEALAKERRPDGSLERGVFSRVARSLAERFGTNEEAERQFFYLHRKELGF